jgi:hypothetical protein
MSDYSPQNHPSAVSNPVVVVVAFLVDGVQNAKGLGQSNLEV